MCSADSNGVLLALNITSIATASTGLILITSLSITFYLKPNLVYLHKISVK